MGLTALVSRAGATVCYFDSPIPGGGFLLKGNSLAILIIITNLKVC